MSYGKVFLYVSYMERARYPINKKRRIYIFYRIEYCVHLSTLFNKNR
jgi:hypothetical protein